LICPPVLGSGYTRWAMKACASPWPRPPRRRARFTNDLAGGTFSTEAGSLKVKFTPNCAPTADPTNYTRAKNTALRIPLADLINTRTGDPDGHGRALHHLRSGNGVNVTANGYTVTTNASYILYMNATDNTSDTLEYVVVDQSPYRAGDSKRFATNTITINVAEALGRVTVENLGGTNIGLKFHGIPNYDYVVQRGDGDHEHINQFVAPPALQAWIGELEQVSFQTGNGCFWHPQYQPNFRALGNLKISPRKLAPFNHLQTRFQKSTLMRRPCKKSWTSFGQV
jgi:hypothetical protein